MLLALGAAAFAAALVVAPALPFWLAIPIYGVGAVICHQLPERSFHIGGVQLPVCARCLGIYGGVAAIALWQWLGVGRPRDISRWSTLSRTALVTAAVPTMVTVLAEWLDVWRASNVVRALAGAPIGAAMAVLLAGAMATLHYDRCTLRRPVESNPPPPPI